MARVAINGLGRIGRAILKLAVDEPGASSPPSTKSRRAHFRTAELYVDGTLSIARKRQVPD
jgi:glyceraldehyde-3-phosphate dehydrogenase/erythrose-4-phosphate dehydrogenase